MDIVNPVTLIDITIYVYSIKSSIQIRNISDWSYEDEDVFLFQDDKLPGKKLKLYLFKKICPRTPRYN